MVTAAIRSSCSIPNGYVRYATFGPEVQRVLNEGMPGGSPRSEFGEARTAYASSGFRPSTGL